MREGQKQRSPLSSNTSGSLEQFKQKFPERFFVRLHMTVLLLGVCTSGLLISKILFEAGLRSLLLRYLVAVVVSYLVFFVLMRVWLSYVGAWSRDDPPLPDLDVVDAIDLGQMSVDVVGGGSGTHGIADPAFSGKGGDFGGGGASDVWGSAATTPDAVQSSVASVGRSASSAKAGGWDIDLDDAGIVLVVLGLLLLAIFGAGAYLVYAAPEILAEAAFEALLAAGLINASRKITRRGWIGSIFRATWIPFLVVLLMTAVFGLVAQKYYPNATRLADIFKHSTADK